MTNFAKTKTSEGYRSDIYRCDFIVPPIHRGWYGVLCCDRDKETWTCTTYWNGYYWLPYPHDAYSRSMKPFVTEEEAVEWLADQPD